MLFPQFPVFFRNERGDDEQGKLPLTCIPRERGVKHRRRRAAELTSRQAVDRRADNRSRETPLFLLPSPPPPPGARTTPIPPLDPPSPTPQPAKHPSSFVSDQLSPIPSSDSLDDYEENPTDEHKSA